MLTGLEKIENWTCVGVILGPHGLTGGLKIKSFCDKPSSIMDYNPLKIQDYPDLLNISIIARTDNIFRVKSKNINNRDSATALTGKLIFAERSKFPQTKEEEYYFADLIDLVVNDINGLSFGKIVNVENYGAGPFIEIAHDDTSETVFLPFDKYTVPIVNLDEGYLVLKEFPKEFFKKAKLENVKNS